MIIKKKPVLKNNFKLKQASNFRTTLRGNNFFGYSTEFKKFASENKQALLKAFRLLQKNKMWLTDLKTKIKRIVFDSTNKIEICEATTGGYTGSARTFKVKIKEKEFFVKSMHLHNAYKKERNEYYTERTRQIKKLETYLAKNNYSINGFKIKLIKPHLLYKKFLVTDFFNEQEVIQASDLPKTDLRNNITYTLNHLQYEYGSMDIGCTMHFTMQKAKLF